ncbi:MAG: hypothetical protein AAFQ36_05320 [Pseudomonadota bacterium]
MRRFLISLFAAVSLIFASTAQAQMLDDAVKAWLADDDETALPLLAALANLGDRDAQFVLGQIERVTPPGADSAFVRGLDRRARISLLRAPKGLSGTSWTVMRQRDGDELAAALMISRLPDAGIDTAQFLYGQGEREAGERLAFEIFDRGNFGEILNLAPDDPLIEGLDFVAWMRTYFGNPPGPNAWTWLDETPAPGRSSGLMMVNFVAPVLAPHLKPGPDLRNFILAMRGTPDQLFENGQLASAASVLKEQMEVDPVLASVNAFCDQKCPATKGFCALEIITRVGGYDRLTFLDTPFEGVISQAEFQTSPRAVGSLTRWMIALEERSLASNQVIDQCVRGVMGEASAEMAAALGE